LTKLSGVDYLQREMQSQGGQGHRLWMRLRRARWYQYRVNYFGGTVEQYRQCEVDYAAASREMRALSAGEGAGNELFRDGRKGADIRIGPVSSKAGRCLRPEVSRVTGATHEGL
jgi:hypothetical protein